MWCSCVRITHTCFVACQTPKSLVSSMAHVAQKAAAQAATVGQRASQVMLKNTGIKTFGGRAWPAVKTELGPPALDSWPQAKKAALQLVESAKKREFMNVSVEKATSNTLLVAEIACWFFVGEIIGRRSLIGYNP
eukprot:CFRG1620T1